MNRQKTVHIYQAGLGVVGKSGVGQAARHQAAALQCAGAAVVRCWTKQRADAVHINTVLPPSLLAALHARKRGETVIWYGHSTAEDFRHSFIGSDLLAPLFGRWLRLCYGMADIIITPTPYAAKILRGYGLKMPIYALSNGVDTGFFAPSADMGRKFRQKYGLAAGDKAVISAGHYMQRKGILDFIALARRMPGCRFYWFGYTAPALVPGGIKAAMKAAPPNLAFPGYISQEELREAYCGADAFVFCSHEETEGIVVLEALACQTPTIVRDIPVYEGWLHDGVNVYKAGSIDDLSACLRAMLGGSLPDVTAAGRRTAQARSLDRIGRSLLSLYPAAPQPEARQPGAAAARYPCAHRVSP